MPVSPCAARSWRKIGIKGLSGCSRAYLITGRPAFTFRYKQNTIVAENSGAWAAALFESWLERVAGKRC